MLEASNQNKQSVSNKRTNNNVINKRVFFESIKRKRLYMTDGAIALIEDSNYNLTFPFCSLFEYAFVYVPLELDVANDVDTDQLIKTRKIPDEFFKEAHRCYLDYEIIDEDFIPY